MSRRKERGPTGIRLIPPVVYAIPLVVGLGVEQQAAGIFDGMVHGVTLGTVNGDLDIEIEKHIHVASKAPWDHIGGNARQYPDGPVD